MKLFNVFILMALVFLVACGGDTVSNGDNDVAAPSIMASTTNVTSVVGIAITDVTMISNGGAVDSYSIIPDLPAGLQLDTDTGTISGVPTAAAVKTDYVVTAENVSGKNTATVTITVVNAAISGNVESQDDMTASVNGESITFTTSNGVSGTLDTDDFSINLNGGSPAVSVSGVSASAATVTLALSRALQRNHSGGPGAVSGENVSVTYIDADSSANLADISPAQIVSLTETTAGDCSDCVLDASGCPF